MLLHLIEICHSCEKMHSFFDTRFVKIYQSKNTILCMFHSRRQSTKLEVDRSYLLRKFDASTKDQTTTIKIMADIHK